jgi:hypothetical protein
MSALVIPIFLNRKNKTGRLIGLKKFSMSRKVTITEP